MTGQLQTTLHRQADALQPWNVDLDAIVRSGVRRVRRRRAALAGGVAGALVLAGGVAIAAHGLTVHHPQPVDDNARPVTYAIGSVIHSGDSRVDVGRTVAQFVRFTDGFVFSDPQQRVYVEKDGRVRKIGDLHDASTPLVAGEDGRQVGWLTPTTFALYPGYSVVHGLPNAINSQFRSGLPVGSSPEVRATWGGYLWMTDGVRTEVIHHDPPHHEYVGWPIHTTGPSMIQDAAGDRLLVRAGDGIAVIDAGLPKPHDPYQNPLKRHFVPGPPQVRNVSTGDLAPDARHWFTAEDGRFTVYFSRDGGSQEPDHAGFVGVTPYQWLGADTIAALGHREDDPDGPVSILRCRVSTNDCTVAVSDIAPEADLVVPNGPTTGTLSRG
jgi:hypothetical protein